MTARIVWWADQICHVLRFRVRWLCEWNERLITEEEPPCGVFCPGECGYDPNDPDDPCSKWSGETI